MSDTDPYMALDAEETVVETIVEPVQPATEETPAANDKIEVPEGSIKEVLAWVGEDVDKAKAALEAEEAGENRKTLVTKLKEITD
jgi:hypothetical protein